MRHKLDIPLSLIATVSEPSMQVDDHFQNPTSEGSYGAHVSI